MRATVNAPSFALASSMLSTSSPIAESVVANSSTFFDVSRWSLSHDSVNFMATPQPDNPPLSVGVSSTLKP